jgi:hypothetical protein
LQEPGSGDHNSGSQRWADKVGRPCRESASRHFEIPESRRDYTHAEPGSHTAGLRQVMLTGTYKHVVNTQLFQCRFLRLKIRDKVFSPVLLTPLNSLSPVLLTPLINIHSRISPRIFEKIQNGQNEYLGAWGTLIHESSRFLPFK